MGYRTVVVLFNDQAHEWQNDPQLGKKIARAMSDMPGTMGYGHVVECTHADTETLALIESYNFKPLAHSSWNRDSTHERTVLQLLKKAAQDLGYKLIRTSKGGRHGR